MKKLISLLVLLGMVLAAPVHAAGTSAEPSLWDSLRKKLDNITPKKKLSTTTAAGGVRGSLADADDVYWKGEAKPVEVEELTAFKKAMALVESGNTAEAKAAFADFIKQNPESALKTDAEAALALLKSAK